MGVIVGPSRSHMLGQYVNQWMQNNQQQQAAQTWQDNQDQAAQGQQQDRQMQAVAKQFMNLPPDVQQQYYGQLPPGAQKYLINPTTLPAHTPTTAEQDAEQVAKNQLGIDTNFKPDAFDTRYAGMSRVTGQVPNKEYTTTAANNSYMQPADFNRGLTNDAGVTMTAKDTAANALAIPQSQAAVRKTNVETQNDILKRDPKSPLSPGYQSPVDAAANKGVVGGVLADPQSYFSLPMDQKKAFLQAVGRAPSKISAVETDRVNSATFGRQLVDDASGLVEKWYKQGIPITGPYIGRYNAASGTWGEAILPSNLPPEKKAEYYGDVAQMREWLTALPIMEAKALAGGRTAYQVIQAVTAAAPSLSKGIEMYRGSTTGLRTRFDQIVTTIHNKQWGGKAPDASQFGGDQTQGQQPAGGGKVIHYDDQGNRIP